MTPGIHTPAPTAAVTPLQELLIGWRGSQLRIRQFALTVDDTTAPLHELCAFRAEIFYANGRRPKFRNAEGRFVDAHSLDHGSYHLTAHAWPDAPPSAYIRLAPPALIDHFQTRALLGPSQFAARLAAHQLPETAIFEHSRLVVSEQARGKGLGALMNAAAMATARALGAAGMVGLCGIDDGQHIFQQRFGFIVSPGTKRYSTIYDDHICVIVNRTQDRAADYESLLHELQRRIIAASHRTQGFFIG